jgi:uncharacterized membrane protein YedE/YeeE
LNPAVVEDLRAMGFEGFETMEGEEIATQFLPDELFGTKGVTFKHVLFLLIGGVLVGFGTRYAGGCTSGHAISGLANLQPASLIAVIGFFIGGMLMTYLILPHILPF